MRKLPVPGPRSERVPWRVPSPAQVSTGVYDQLHLDPRLLFLGAPSTSFRTPAARLLQSLRREALRGRELRQEDGACHRMAPCTS